MASSSSYREMKQVQGKFKEISSNSWIVAVIFLCLLVVVCLAIIIGLASGLGVVSNQVARARSSARSTCTTTTCIKLSSSILASMDTSIDPCQDFAGFACNNYIKNTIIPQGRTSLGAADMPGLIATKRIQVLMESGNDMGVAAIRKAIDYYQSCLKQNGGNLISFFANLGGWPLLEIVNQSVPEGFSSNEQNYILDQLYGGNTFFTFSISPTRNLIEINSGGLTASPAFYTSADAEMRFLQSAVPILSNIEPNIATVNYQNAARKIFQFEKALADITSTFAPSRSISTLASLIQEFPEYAWITNLNYLGTLSVNKVNVTNDTAVSLLVPLGYFTELSQLVRTTSFSTLFDYSRWQLIQSLLTELRELFIPDFTSQTSRYRTCVLRVASHFPYAVGKAFQMTYISPSVKTDLESLIRELRSALRERFSGSSWLTDRTKTVTLSRLHEVKEFLIFPDNLDNAALNRIYSIYDIASSYGYLTNTVNAIKGTKILQFEQLAISNDRQSWYLPLPVPPTTPGALYFSLLNQIYVLEGILKPPYYNEEWPDYFKYGTIGYVVGHEYLHGFDSDGQHFNLANWWRSSSQQEFNRRAQCYVDQYGNYSFGMNRVDGQRTLAENIADNGGLAAAYLAYRNRVKKSETPQLRLLGLQYSPDQLFFIASAQLWCESYTPQGESAALRDPHSPGPVRIAGVVSNSRDFASVFNCPSGSPMNPAKKCELW